MELFKFALFNKFDDSLNHLAQFLARNETWIYSNPAKELAEGNNAARFAYPILRNYLEYTYRKLVSENKVVYTTDRKFACFNTGLVTTNLEDIYAFFEDNKSYTKRSPYYFKAFIKKSDKEFLMLFSHNAPDTADYFTEPDRLIFNPTLQLIIDVDHIIMDSKHRFPPHLQKASDREIRAALMGAIDETKKLVKINYKTAVPQYYSEKIQLLLPLSLSAQKADLAIVVDRINPTTYTAQACLTVGMAFNNARLIASPDSNWLMP